ARRAFEARTAALGLAPREERLPLVAIGSVSLPDDPPLPAVLAHLDRPVPPWAPPGGATRIQKFGTAPCPGVEAALAAAGLRWEAADPTEPAVAERLWVQLRLLGHPPRQGTSLPVWLVGTRVLQGCPEAGAVAHALPEPAIVAWARAQRDADPEGFARRTVRLLSTLRDRPRLGLKRLLLAPGLLDPASSLAGQLRLAQRRRPLRFRPWGSLNGPVTRVPDPWTAGDGAQALLSGPDAWAVGPMLASARLVDVAGVPTLEVQWAPDPELPPTGAGR
ncbi:MAG: hypothetical protein KC613_22565, partial [Myxococcales bacterium]|nr:hypothetical protein [Myxococcales bacterium]